MISKLVSTPCVLFAFNRPNKTNHVISALRSQTVMPPKLIVFSDGPQDSTDEQNVYAVRQIIHSIDWIDVELIERERNFGCAQNIIQGLTDVFQHHDRAAVLEDDTLPAAHWYESICLLLDNYANDPMVFSVGGYPSIKADALLDYPYDVILSPRFSCWGWGTWSNQWQDILTELHNFKNPFKNPDNIPRIAGSDLRESIRLVDERPGYYWDYPISLLCLHRGLLNALTRYYLVQNIGTDSGTHGKHLSQAILRFIEENNRIEERLPASLPQVILMDSISQAVQQYVNEINSVQTIQNSIKRYCMTARLTVKRVLKTLGIDVR